MKDQELTASGNDLECGSTGANISLDTLPFWPWLWADPALERGDEQIVMAERRLRVNYERAREPVPNQYALVHRWDLITLMHKFWRFRARSGLLDDYVARAVAAEAELAALRSALEPFARVATPLYPGERHTSPLYGLERQTGTGELRLYSPFSDCREELPMYAEDFRRAAAALQLDANASLSSEASARTETLDEPLSPTSPPHDHRLEGLGSSSVRSEPGSTDWRTIDSAPRDGTAILVFAPGRSDRWEGDLGDLICRCAWHPDAGFCVCELRDPTHWMPLPEPPEGV
jgi:hypothetical protein